MTTEAMDFVNSLASYHSEWFQTDSLERLAANLEGPLAAHADTEWAVLGIYTVIRVMASVLKESSVRDDVLMMIAASALTHECEWGLPKNQLDELKQLLGTRGEEYDTAIEAEPSKLFFFSKLLARNLVVDGEILDGMKLTADLPPFSAR